MIYVKIGGKKYTLPVNPEEIEVSHPHVDKTAEIAGLGEILIPQKPGLREITFNSFFPGYDDPYVHDYRNPQTLAKAFEKAWKNRTKCRLIIARSIDYDTNMQCVITDWKITDKGGEPDDIYYSIKLKEYRDYSAQSVTFVNQTEDNTAQATATAERPIATPVLRVGAQVIVNGPLCYDSAGNPPWVAASGLSATVMRIETGQLYPIYVGSGWVQESELQIVG